MAHVALGGAGEAAPDVGAVDRVQLAACPADVVRLWLVLCGGGVGGVGHMVWGFVVG